MAIDFLVVQRGKTTIRIMYETLRIELEQAMLNFCRASLKKHAGELVYSVALYTSPLYEYVVGSISTKQSLEQAARTYLSKRDYQEQWKTLQVAMRNLKWSPCDSSYLGEFDDLFSKATAILGDIWEPLDIDDDRTTENAHSNIHRVFIAYLLRFKRADSLMRLGWYSTS